MNTFTRRDFVAALSMLGLTPRAFAAAPRGEGSAGPDAVFAHGVASGDPLHDRVILWTRVTPKGFGEEIEGRGVSRAMKECAARARGTFTTDVTRDFTVKVDAKGLEPGKTYYYRFETRGAHSSIGRTRRCRCWLQSWRMAFASCSNYPYGYFNAYARIAGEPTSTWCCTLATTSTNIRLASMRIPRSRACAMSCRQRDRVVDGLSAASCAVQVRSGPAGSASPTCVHLRLG